MNSRAKWRSLILVLPLLLFALLRHKSGQRPQLLPGLRSDVTSLAFSPDGKTIVCGTRDGDLQEWGPNIAIWRPFSLVDQDHYTMHPAPASLYSVYTQLRFAPDGRTLYSIGSDTHEADAWDVATRRHKFAFNDVTNPGFDVSPNGRWAALGNNNGVQLAALQERPLPRGRTNYGAERDFRFLPWRHLASSRIVTCVAFSPDSTLLAVGSTPFQWQSAFWNAQTGQPAPLRAPVAAQGVPLAIAWSPDGKRVAAMGPDGISICDLTTMRSISVPGLTPRTSGPIAYLAWDYESIAWSPDDKTLFTGGDEVRQWRASDLKLERSFGVAGPAALSPDGTTLATTSRSYTSQGVWLWTVG